MDRAMTQASKPWRQLEWLSEDTLLLSFDDPLTPATAAMLASLVENLQRTQPAWLWDLTPGFGKLLVHYRPNLIHSAALEHALAEALAAPVDSLNSNTDPALEIPVCYDARVAPDLEQVAVQTGLSIEAVIALHCSVEYRVLAVGFALGFAYLGTLPDGLRLPRRATPRTQVPAGSVAIAGAQTTVYPTDTPGGWHIIGRTQQPMVQVGDTIALTLPLGRRVRFSAIPYAQFQTREPCS